MHFECQKYSCIEGVNADPGVLVDLHSSHTYLNRFSGILRPKLFLTFRTDIRPWEIYNLIATYSKRSMTYEHDTLNGLLGAYALFQRKYKVQQIWGIPYLPRSTQRSYTPRESSSLSRRIPARVIEGLAWEHSSTLVRCPDFLSWSWTG